MSKKFTLLFFLCFTFFSSQFLFAGHYTNTGISVTKSLPLGKVIIAPQPITICSGAAIVIKGDIEVPAPDTYLWQVLQAGIWINAPSNSAVPNTNADYSAVLLSNTTATDMIYSIRRMITTAGVVNYDSFFDVTVQPSAAITNNTINTPAVAVFCSSGTPAAITGAAATGGNGNILYQWQSSLDNVTFTNIAGATASAYTPPSPLTVTTYYRRMASAGNCVAPSTSNVIGLTVIPALSNNIISGPLVNTFCTASTPAAITASLPAGGTGTYNYQWQSSTDNITFTDITGANSQTYNPSVVTTTTYYRRSVTSGACLTPLISNVVTITILSAVSNNIITAPSVNTYCTSGDLANITGSTPTGATGVYAYQWQQSTDNSNYTDVAGAVSQSYDPPAVTVTTYFRRVVTSGQCLTPVYSNVVTVTIVPVPANPVTTQPSVMVCPGSSATLSISSPQSGLTYNWYNSPAKTTLLFTGVNYVTPGLSAPQTYYVESSNGICTSALLGSEQVLIATPPAAPLLTNNTVTICSNTIATFTVASPQAGYTYNWYQNVTGGSVIFTGTNFTSPAVSSSTVYYVEAINADGCISTRMAANVVTLPLPTVISTTSGSGGPVCPGASIILSATASVDNSTINWYATPTGGTPVFTGSVYTIAALNNNTTYYVEVIDNNTGCISAARQAVQASILQQLAAPVVTVGITTLSSVTFNWSAVPNAIAYLVSIDNGVTYTDPSSGSAGLSHTISGLSENQSVTILVKAVGALSCQLGTNSAAVTTKARSPSDEVYVPNAFTPNGDGKNDIVYVHSESVKSLVFYVYSQWGELLFTSTNIATGWDGTFKGYKEPAGVYVYSVQAVMNNGNLFNKKGTITLIR